MNVASYAFDPRAGEEASALGRLTTLQARISPDLLADGLKATGAGKLFQAFEEPGNEVRPAAVNRLVVEIPGLGVYDPDECTLAVTGELAPGAETLGLSKAES